MSMIDCLNEALRQKHITADEHEELLKRFTEISKAITDPTASKAALAAEIKAEAAHRRRVSGLMEAKRTILVQALDSYRDRNGNADPVEAFLQMHERLGRQDGTYMDDAESKRIVIRNEAHQKLQAMLLEFKKGLLTGDLRRRKKAVAARLDNVVKEIFGEKTGDETAAALAKSWAVVADELKARFNAAGGAIGTLEKWGLPQGHDAQALMDFGRAKWINYMMGNGVLDRERMIHPIAKRVMSDAELRESLGVAWDRITTDGWIDREVTGQSVGKGALWSQHADHRFLHFKGAGAWMAYAKKFGQPDAFAAMTGHINKMARDIAHMETFGPNPALMRNYLKQVLTKRARSRPSNDVVIAEQVATMKELQSKLSKPNPDYIALSDRMGELSARLDMIRRKYTPQLGGKPSKRNKARIEAAEAELFELSQKIMPYWDDPSLITIEDQDIRVKLEKLFEEMRDPIQFKAVRNPGDYLNKQLHLADAMWEMQRGSAMAVSQGMANLFASSRNIITAASLGSAWLSSLADPAFGQDMRIRFGMGMAKANFGRVMALVMKDMITKGTREDAIAAGLGLDGAVDVMHRAAAENRTIDGRAWTGFVADRVLAIGALSPWTQAGKHMAGLDLMNFLADVSTKDWKALGARTQNALKSHGFDAESWEIIRKAPIHEPRSGARYLRPNEIEAAAGRELSERYLGMIMREVRFAVPEATVRARATWMAGKKGTIGGELWLSMMQFKSFGMTVATMYAATIAREMMARQTSSLAPIAALVVTGSVLGAMAMALKDIKDGRDPRKWMDEKTYLDPAFWAAAALQSGGLGIYGDFAFSNTGRNNQSLAKTLAGPLVDRVDNLLALTTGNLFQGYRGERTNMGREALRFGKSNMPGANLWFMGLPLRRIVFDEIQKFVDPDAYKAFAREEQIRYKDFGQRYWWRPGQTRPDRAPDLSRLTATTR